jgi:hypothetical protein
MTADATVEPTVPPTPSKIMFSPGLRYDADGKVTTAPATENENENGNEGAETFEDNDENEDDEDEEIFNPYLFIANLPNHSSVVVKDKVCLPAADPSKQRPTLALDLDETLVHCTVEPIQKPDLTFPVTFNGAFYQVYVRKRPYLDYFLETVSKSFEVRHIATCVYFYMDMRMSILRICFTLANTFPISIFLFLLLSFYSTLIFGSPYFTEYLIYLVPQMNKNETTRLWYSQPPSGCMRTFC